jgi:urea transport system permease protein
MDRPSMLRRFWPWILIVALAIVLPFVLPPFRLNLLGRFLALGIVALGVDLIWGYTGLLSLGQGIFFALGAYAIGMHLQLSSLDSGQLPEFFGLYGVKELPAFWQPFNSAFFTFFAIWIIPALVAGLLGFLVF